MKIEQIRTKNIDYEEKNGWKVILQGNEFQFHHFPHYIMKCYNVQKVINKSKINNYTSLSEVDSFHNQFMVCVGERTIKMNGFWFSIIFHSFDHNW